MGLNLDHFHYCQTMLVYNAKILGVGVVMTERVRRVILTNENLFGFCAFSGKIVVPPQFLFESLSLAGLRTMEGLSKAT